MTPPAEQRRDGGGTGGSRKPSGKGGGGGKGRGQGGQRRGQGGQGGQARGQGGRTSGGKGKGGGRGKPPVEQSRADELAAPLRKVLERIPATQREVLEWRMGLKDGHPHDLSSTAEQLGLTVAETKEIEQRAFEHIREVVPLSQLQKLLGS